MRVYFCYIIDLSEFDDHVLYYKENNFERRGWTTRISNSYQILIYTCHPIYFNCFKNYKCGILYYIFKTRKNLKKYHR